MIIRKRVFLDKHQPMKKFTYFYTSGGGNFNINEKLTMGQFFLIFELSLIFLFYFKSKSNFD